MNMNLENEWKEYEYKLWKWNERMYDVDNEWNNIFTWILNIRSEWKKYEYELGK